MDAGISPVDFFLRKADERDRILIMHNGHSSHIVPMVEKRVLIRIINILVRKLVFSGDSKAYVTQYVSGNNIPEIDTRLLRLL